MARRASSACSGHSPPHQGSIVEDRRHGRVGPPPGRRQKQDADRDRADCLRGNRDSARAVLADERACRQGSALEQRAPGELHWRSPAGEQPHVVHGARTRTRLGRERDGQHPIRGGAHDLGRYRIRRIEEAIRLLTIERDGGNHPIVDQNVELTIALACRVRARAARAVRRSRRWVPRSCGARCRALIARR